MAEASRLALALVLCVISPVSPVSPVACQKEGEGPPIQKTKEEITKKKDPDPDPPKTRTPEKHRAAGEPCARETKSTTFGPKAITPPGPPCKANADCKEEKNGRCSAGGTCTYDSCYVDGDCRVDGKGGVCVCSEEGKRGYSCLHGDCSVDSDCGKNGFCSPTYGMSCGPFTGTIGWYCHTAKDKCVDDGDCVKGGDHGYCAFNNELGIWTCGYGHCVG